MKRIINQFWIGDFVQQKSTNRIGKILEVSCGIRDNKLEVTSATVEFTNGQEKVDAKDLQLQGKFSSANRYKISLTLEGILK